MTSFDDKYLIAEIDESNSAEIEQFLIDHFLVEESLNRATKMSVEGFKPFLDKLLKRTLNVPFSQVIRSRETNEIVACAMSSIWKKDENSNDDKNNDEIFCLKNENNCGGEAIGRILTKLHESFYKHRPDLQAVLHLEILSVAKQHQRQGLASKLMSLQEDAQKMKKFGLSGIGSEISSHANQCLMRKRGYAKLDEVLLSTEVDADGQVLLKCDDGTDRVELVYKGF